MAQPRKPRAEPSHTFFVDRSLGSHDVPSALATAGAMVEIHSDHFEPECPDEEWIQSVAARQWAILTKDKRIRRRKLEQMALKTASAAAFVLTAGDLTGHKMGETFVAALPRMNRLLAKYTRPLIATVSRSSAVTVKVGERRGAVRR